MVSIQQLFGVCIENIKKKINLKTSQLYSLRRNKFDLFLDCIFNGMTNGFSYDNQLQCPPETKYKHLPSVSQKGGNDQCYMVNKWSHWLQLLESCWDHCRRVVMTKNRQNPRTFPSLFVVNRKVPILHNNIWWQVTQKWMNSARNPSHIPYSPKLLFDRRFLFSIILMICGKRCPSLIR